MGSSSKNVVLPTPVVSTNCCASPQLGVAVASSPLRESYVQRTGFKDVNVPAIRPAPPFESARQRKGASLSTAPTAQKVGGNGPASCACKGHRRDAAQIA